MERRALLTLLLTGTLLTGCAEARSTATSLKDCAGLAGDVARSGLAGTPTQAEAEAAVRRLDERVETLDSPDVRNAATDLRDRLRELQAAARSGDAAAASQATSRAREAARRTAQVCGLPVDQFLG